MIIGVGHHSANLFQEVLRRESIRKYGPQRHRIHTIPNHIFELYTTPTGHD